MIYITTFCANFMQMDEHGGKSLSSPGLNEAPNNTIYRSRWDTCNGVHKAQCFVYPAKDAWLVQLEQLSIS